MTYHAEVDMSPAAVGQRIADDWLEGTDENTLEELCAIIHRLGERLGNIAEIIHGDDAVPTMARAFREAADDMEMSFGERVGHGERLMAYGQDQNEGSVNERYGDYIKRQLESTKPSPPDGRGTGSESSEGHSVADARDCDGSAHGRAHERACEVPSEAPSGTRLGGG